MLIRYQTAMKLMFPIRWSWKLVSWVFIAALWLLQFFVLKHYIWGALIVLMSIAVFWDDEDDSSSSSNTSNTISSTKRMSPTTESTLYAQVLQRVTMEAASRQNVKDALRAPSYHGI